MAIKPIQILINAKDNASSVFSSLQAKVAAVGAAIATYFGVGAFVDVVKGAADFEAAMSRVKAATGASGEEMQALQKAAQDAGANTQYTSIEAAGALENLAKAGLGATDAIATLPAVLQLAQAGDIGLAESSELVTKAIMGMGLAFTDAGRVADVLAMGANATNTSVQGLAQALSYAAPVASSLGISLESTVAIIGKFADAGIDAGRAGTALNSILSQFSNPASKFREELAAAGITTGNFETALHQLAAAGPAGSKAIIAVGQEAGPALRALLNQGMGALDDLTAKLRTAEGSAAAAAKVMQDNLNGALGGLGSAWQTVKDVLGTPVLPVLKEGVDQLAAALRGAVADGTVQRFGEAFATAFQGAIKWIKEFAGSVDFGALVARLQGWADEVAATMTRVGEYATNAGDIVKTAWGVMTAGTSVVMGAIYKVAEGFASVLSGVQSGLALVMDGLSKVTFGSVSKSFAEAAADIRLSAEATGAVSEAFAEKSASAFAAAADGAELAREGFAGLTTEVSSNARAQQAWASAVQAARAEQEAATAATTAAVTAQQKKTQADADAKAAAESNRQAIADLRAEYDTLIASGNLQEAAKKLDQINAALRATPAAAQDATKAAQETAAQVAAAFDRLGVTSSAALKQQAAAAKRDFETIKDSGLATAEDISSAFKKAADAAIASNNGIAPSWVRAQASVRGYTIEVDSSGKSVLKLRDEIERTANTNGSATKAMAGQWQGVRSAIDGATKSLSNYGEKLSEGVTQVGSGGTQFRNKDGMTSDAKGNVQQQWVWTRSAIIDYLTESGLDKLLAEDLARQFSNPDGSVDYTAGAAQKQWGGKYGTLAEALGKMADYYKFGDGKFQGQQRTQWLQQQGGAPAPAPTPSMFQRQQVTVNLQLNGQSFGAVDTDSDGAAVLQGLLSELERAKRNAGR